MGHQLLVEAQTVVPERYKNYVGGGELIRGVPLRLNVYATNIGNSFFTGGHIEYATIDYYGMSGFAVASQTLASNVLCPAITKNRTVILATDVIGAASGSCWLNFRITAIDNQTVEYHRTVGDAPSQNSVKLYFTVIERELLNIEILLDELIKRFPK